jgi:hypothetical protein
MAAFCLLAVGCILALKETHQRDLTADPEISRRPVVVPSQANPVQS